MLQKVSHHATFFMVEVKRTSLPVFLILNSEFFPRFIAPLAVHTLENFLLHKLFEQKKKLVRCFAEDSAESRRTTPSTSPRHSPSSYGDDLSQNQSSILASDAKSIDSGGNLWNYWPKVQFKTGGDSIVAMALLSSCNPLVQSPSLRKYRFYYSLTQ